MSTLTVQKWGNSLAVRIPSAVARSAGLRMGQPVQVCAHDSGVLVTPTASLQLSLQQKLALFDPGLHGGEAMLTTRIGNEAL